MWENFNKRSPFRCCKVTVLNVLLFFVTVILLTPISILESLGPMIVEIRDFFPEGSIFGAMIANYFTPMILFMFNYVLIPSIVDYISYYEEFETKSARH